MAPTKLSYFNITGLGEPIRYLLSYGGVEFEDDRHTHESFAPLKDRKLFFLISLKPKKNQLFKY
jgi:prostaglandin-H2 D-isomerase / glutathione transferase